MAITLIQNQVRCGLSVRGGWGEKFSKQCGPVTYGSCLSLGGHGEGLGAGPSPKGHHG